MMFSIAVILRLRLLEPQPGNSRCADLVPPRGAKAEVKQKNQPSAGCRKVLALRNHGHANEGGGVMHQLVLAILAKALLITAAAAQEPIALRDMGSFHVG